MGLFLTVTKRLVSTFRILSACALVSFTLNAQTGSAIQKTPEETAAPTTSLVARELDTPAKTLLSLPKWLVLSGQYRGRFEDDTALKFVPNASDMYYLQRVRFALSLKPTSWLRFTSELQDSRNYFYGSRPLPATTSDPIDLRQAYVELGVPEGSGFNVKVGRQEIALGSSRLIGSGEWLNSGHSHDIVRASYTNVNQGLKVDTIAGSQVLINPQGFDEHIPGEHWYGIYTAASKWIPGASIEPYYLLKTDAKAKGELGLGSGAVSANGLRFTGKARYGFDYSAEVVKEWGHYGSDNIDALGGAYVLGWQVATDYWEPRLSAEYDHASGDSHAKDGERQTFDNFYTGHGYYGFADQVGWRNVRSARAGIDCVPSRRLKLRLDFLNDYLATTQDGLYSVGGTQIALNRNAKSNHIGEEADILVEFKLSGQTSFKTGFNHIFPGAYLRQTTKGSSYSSPYVMWTKNF